MIRRVQLVMLSAVLGFVLSACATEPNPVPQDPSPAKTTPAPIAPQVDLPEDDPIQRPQLVQDRNAPVAPDLERLAKTFVRYAVGDSDTFPHWESVSMAIGGQAVLSIDDIVAALPNRDIWKICPADWEVYGASSCPVDLLGPINAAVVNEAVLVYSAEYRDVVCAPPRSGPLPHGRLVVLGPTQEWRSCASDFALVLAADAQGQLRSVDLTLSEP